MNTETRRNVLVGFTAIAALICLGTMMLLFGYVPKFLERSYLVHVELPDASGLYEGSRAEFGGVDIGYVYEVSRAEPLRPEVVVSVKVNDDQPLPSGVSAYVSAPLIGGSNRLVFDLPPDTGDLALVELPRTGAARVTGRAVSPFEAIAAGLNDEIQEPLAQLGRALEDFEALADSWTSLGTNLTAMTEVVSPEAADAGDASATLYTLVLRADQRMTELGAAIEGLTTLVGDESFATDLRVTVAEARAAAEGLNAAIPRVETTLTDTMTSVDERVAATLDELTPRYSAVGDELAATNQALQDLVSQMQAGDGTVGRLMSDPALYQNLNDASERLNLALEEFRATMESFTEDGVRLKL